jgi:hypothetical protein
MASFIANEVEGSLEDLDTARIKCPICKQVCPMDGGLTSGLVSTPKGLFLMHKSCVEKWNQQAAAIQALQEMGVEI